MKTKQHSRAEWELMKHDYTMESIASMNPRQIQSISWFLGHPTSGPDAWTESRILKKLTADRAPLLEKVLIEQRKMMEVAL